jgi:hypothetical protein
MRRTELRQECLADPRTVEVDPLSDLGEHSHVVSRRSLGDVLCLIAGKNCKICRLTGLVNEIEKDAVGDWADERASGICQWQDAKAQRVPAGRQLPCVAPFAERRKQSVHGRKRNPGAGRYLSDRNVRMPASDELENVKGAIDRLNTTSG